jgi:CBS domain-containing protein
MKARDIMTAPVVTITPDTTIREIATLLLEKRISGVPVMDGERIAGVVSEGDLLRRHEIGTERQRPGGPWWMAFFEDSSDPAKYVKSHALRAADIMTTPVICVDEDTSAIKVAALFEKRRVKRVPVTRGGRLAGIVTRANLVQALALTSARQRPVPSRGDGDIRARLLAELGAQAWWPATANVIVTDGVVHFWGLYENEHDKRAARVAAENVPGVLRIADHRVRRAELPSMG